MIPTRATADVSPPPFPTQAVQGAAGPRKVRGVQGEPWRTLPEPTLLEPWETYGHQPPPGPAGWTVAMDETRPVRLLARLRPDQASPFAVAHQQPRGPSLCSPLKLGLGLLVLVGIG